MSLAQASRFGRRARERRAARAERRRLAPRPPSGPLLLYRMAARGLAREFAEIVWSDRDSEVTVNVMLQHPPKAESGYAGVAKAAVDKMPPSHLLIFVRVLALAAAAVGGHKLGLW